MSVLPALEYLLLGIAAGVLGGLMGVGGGIIIVPAFVLLFGMNQKMAQGTSLALLLPPIGILAAWVYHKQGFVDLPVAGLVCAGFFIGGFLGAKVATLPAVSNATLTRVFGVMLLLVAIKMIIGK